MKLKIHESKLNVTANKTRKNITEAISPDLEIKMVIGSWGAYNSANEKALGSNWLTLSDYTDWDDIIAELERQGFDVEGEDEELFIQDTDNLPAIGEYENPQVVFETCLESGILNDSNARDIFEAYCEVRSWDDFKRLVEQHGSRWSDDIYIWADYDWDDLGREIFEMNYPELMNYDVIDNYFDFTEYGESLQYDGNFERFSGGIIEICD